MPEPGLVRSAGGVVLRQQDVLLIRVSDIKGRPIWSFPKGRLDAGETPAQAAVREVLEEQAGAAESRQTCRPPNIGFSARDDDFVKRLSGSRCRPSNRAVFLTGKSRTCSGSIVRRRWAV